MSVSFKNDNVEISAIRDRAMFHTFAGNQSFVIKDIGDELAITYSASSFVVSIGTGEAVICGGSTLVEGTNEITLNQNESGYIVIRVDLAQTGDNICQFKAVPTLVQENINDEGYIYDFPLARYTTNGSGVNSFTDQRIVRNNITDNVVKTIDGRAPTNNNINLTDVVKTINGIAPTNNNVVLNYISKINNVPADSDFNFRIGEGSNITFTNSGTPPYTIYTLNAMNNAYSFNTELLAAIKGSLLDFLRSNKRTYYNTYIKTDTSECTDAPNYHKTEKAAVYVVRDIAGETSSPNLNATCLWVSLENNSVMFKRSIVNENWNGGWKFVGGADLLWTNDNPTAHFAPKTIYKNLSEYSNVLILFKVDVDESSTAFNSYQILRVDGGQTPCNAIYPYDNRLQINSRLVQILASEIRFNWNAWKWSSPNFTRGEDNSVMVPLNIWAL